MADFLDKFIPKDFLESYVKPDYLESFTKPDFLEQFVGSPTPDTTPSPATAASVAPSPAKPAPDKYYNIPYESTIVNTAKKYGIPTDLAVNLVRAESSFNQKARSKAGAIGLTQLMPGTARAMGVNPYDPVQNVEGGFKYLRQQYDAFGDWNLALAAYNAGPGAVKKYKGVPPYKETRNYVRTINGKPVKGELRFPVKVNKPKGALDFSETLPASDFRPYQCNRYVVGVLQKHYGWQGTKISDVNNKKFATPISTEQIRPGAIVHLRPVKKAGYGTQHWAIVMRDKGGTLTLNELITHPDGKTVGVGTHRTLESQAYRVDRAYMPNGIEHIPQGVGKVGYYMGKAWNRLNKPLLGKPAIPGTVPYRINEWINNLPPGADLMFGGPTGVVSASMRNASRIAAAAKAAGVAGKYGNVSSKAGKIVSAAERIRPFNGGITRIESALSDIAVMEKKVASLRKAASMEKNPSLAAKLKRAAEVAQSEVDASMANIKPLVSKVGIDDALRTAYEARQLDANVSFPRATIRGNIPIEGPESVGQAALRVGTEVINAPRTIMTSFDLSAPLRQGALLIGEPKQFLGAAKKMFKAAVSENGFKQIMDDIIANPGYDDMIRSGVSITTVGGMGIKTAEEAYIAGGMLEKIPILGKGIAASERAYTGFLNSLRAGVFYKYKDLWKDVATERDFAQLAKFINAASGRGGLGVMEDAAPTLANVFFSPRFFASRIEAPLMMASSSRLVRGVAMKNLIAFTTSALALLAMAKLAGAEVEIDPRSSDFGRAKFGNTRFDFFAGYQPIVRFAAQLITGQGKSATGKYKGHIRQQSRAELIGRFFRSKLAPMPGNVWSVVEGKDYAGQKFGAKELARSIIPMVISDTREALQSSGIGLGIAAGIASMFGIGVSSYGTKGGGKVESFYPTAKSEGYPGGSTEGYGPSEGQGYVPPTPIKSKSKPKREIGEKDFLSKYR